MVLAKLVSLGPSPGCCAHVNNPVRVGIFEVNNLSPSVMEIQQKTFFN